MKRLQFLFLILLGLSLSACGSNTGGESTELGSPATGQSTETGSVKVSSSIWTAPSSHFDDELIQESSFCAKNLIFIKDDGERETIEINGIIHVGNDISFVKEITIPTGNYIEMNIEFETGCDNSNPVPADRLTPSITLFALYADRSLGTYDVFEYYEKGQVRFLIDTEINDDGDFFFLDIRRLQDAWTRIESRSDEGIYSEIDAIVKSGHLF